MRVQQPRPNFCDRRIGASCYVVPNFREQASQFARHVTPLWPRFGFAGVVATGEGLGDVRDTDHQHGGDLPHGQTCIERCEHPFAQVLGVGPASFPKHANLRSSTTGDL